MTIVIINGKKGRKSQKPFLVNMVETLLLSGVS